MTQDAQKFTEEDLKKDFTNRFCDGVEGVKPVLWEWIQKALRDERKGLEDRLAETQKMYDEIKSALEETIHKLGFGKADQRIKALEAERDELIGIAGRMRNHWELSQAEVERLKAEVERVKIERDGHYATNNFMYDQEQKAKARLAEAVRVLENIVDKACQYGALVSDRDGVEYDDAKVIQNKFWSICKLAESFLQSPTKGLEAEVERLSKKEKDLYASQCNWIDRSVKLEVEREQLKDRINFLEIQIETDRAHNHHSPTNSEASKRVHSVCSAHQEREPDCRACNTYIGGVVMPEARGGCEHDGGWRWELRDKDSKWLDGKGKKYFPTCPFCDKKTGEK